MLDLIPGAVARTTLVVAAAWLVLRLFRVRNPHVEALVWRQLLIAGLALPALLYWRLAPSFDAPFELPEIVTSLVAGEAAAGVTPDWWMRPRFALAVTWLGVASLLLLRFVIGLVSLWRVVRAAEPLMPSALDTSNDVRISAHLRSPATFGSVILLPVEARSWPAERLEPVLAHERAHVRSHDAYWAWLAQIHTAIFWFNPVSWWLQRRLELLAETTSDDAVVAARHDPLAYAELLLDFARYPNHRSTAMSVAESNVPKRIERLLARIPPATAVPRAVRWAALGALIPVVVFAASTTRAAPPVEPTVASEQSPGQTMNPHVWLASAPDPDNYFPAFAKAERVTGYAIVEVDLDVAGKVTDARVLEVQPADPRYGFADAALQLAWKASFRNETRNVASMKFKVKFDLASREDSAQVP